jgi:hypothetical protein
MNSYFLVYWITAIPPPFQEDESARVSIRDVTKSKENREK